MQARHGIADDFSPDAERRFTRRALILDEVHVPVRAGARPREWVGNSLVPDEKSQRFCFDLHRQLIGGFKSRAHFNGNIRRSLLNGALCARHLMQRYAANNPAVNASNTAICSGTDAGANSGCSRQTRIRRPCSMISCGYPVQTGAKPCESLELFKLGISQLKIAGNRAISGPLCFAADTRNRFSYINRRQDAQFEKRRRKINLPVGNRNKVGRNVGGYVLRFGFDDGQGRERTATKLIAQMGSAFQHSRMNVEYVAWKGFAAVDDEAEGRSRDMPAHDG